MSGKYRIYDQTKPHFLTLTVVGWVDLFARKDYKYIIIDSLRYCQHKKGLDIYGYSLMSSHLHMIARASGSITLSEILRDFKKFTSKALIKRILEGEESRRDWMLGIFKGAGKCHYNIWQDGNHPEEITSNKFFDEKLDYIHNNPVAELIVERPEDYYFSSARNYASLSNCLDIVIESVKQNTFR
ncbi:MAG: transposase [Bacteroidota bacterium]|nr:transposase [Bacteroidota bacterium]